MNDTLNLAVTATLNIRNNEEKDAWSQKMCPKYFNVASKTLAWANSKTMFNNHEENCEIYS